MDNIIFEKTWKDYLFFSLRISLESEFVTAYQYCYIDDIHLRELSEKIQEYMKDYTAPCYLEFGDKKGNHTPAFSMLVLPADVFGRVKIEVDVEIDDEIPGSETRSHRCIFFVNGELGAIERLGENMRHLWEGDVGAKISLFEQY